MTDFRSQQAIDANDMTSTFELALTATYRAVSGVQVITAVVIEIGDELSAGLVGTNPASVAIIRVKSADVSDPQIDDEIAIGSSTWRVLRPLKLEGPFWVLDCVKDVRMGTR